MASWNSPVYRLLSDAIFILNSAAMSHVSRWEGQHWKDS